MQFEFISHPEYIKEGMKLLFREGKTKVGLHRQIISLLLTKTRSPKGLGVITRLL